MYPILYDRMVRPRLINERYILPNVHRALGRTPGRVLDFGCGTGCNAFIFDQFSYVGVDKDADRIAYATQAYTGYDFRAVRTDSLPFDAASFDAVFVCGVLHHLDDDACSASLARIADVLRPGGRLLLLEPCFTRTHRIRNLAMAVFDKGRHIRDTATYAKLVERMFEVDATWHFGTPNLYMTIVLAAIRR